MLHVKKYIVVCVLLLAAAGCAVGPDFKQPNAKMPAVWSGLDSFGQQQASTAVAGPTSLAAWWSIFNDPILSGLVEKALAANHDLKIAEARVRQARAERTIAAAGLWPSLDASGSYRRTGSRTSASSAGASSQQTGVTGTATGTTPSTGTQDTATGKSVAVRQDLYQVGLDASWELDIFGGTRRSVEAANASIQAAEEDRRDVMVTLIGEVGTTYLNLRGFQQQIAIAKKNLAAQEHTAEITRKRHEAGLANGLDMANAQGQAASTRSQIPLLEAGARQAIYSLGVLLGSEPASLDAELSPVAPIPVPPAEIPVGLPSDLLRRRPDVRRAEAQLHAATANIGVATADLFPKFSLTGASGLKGDEWHTLGNRNNRTWSVGPSVTWPVFAAGRILANVKVQNALQEQAVATYEKTVLTSLKDVESALVAFAKEQQRYAALTDAVENGRNAVDIATRLYTVGLSDFLNVLIAQRTLFAYEDAWVQSTSSLTTDLIALYKALGGGWE